MCRLLAVWSKQEKTISSRSLMKDWITAWLKSTKYDHNLKKLFGFAKANCIHKDGWGVVATNTDQNSEVSWIQTNMDLNPVFSYKKNTLLRSLLVAPFFKSDNQILLAHARRASVNMPVTFQQIQPLLIHDDKSSWKMYLSHNGKVSSELVNDQLDKELQINPMELGEYSDTQILSRLIKQKLEEKKPSKNSVKQFWIPFLQELIELHQDTNTNYQVQLNIIEITNNKPQLIAISALSDGSMRMMPYYRLFTGRRENFWVICSSTIVDYFKQKHEADLWEIEKIPNNSLVNLTKEGKFHSQSIT